MSNKTIKGAQFDATAYDDEDDNQYGVLPVGGKIKTSAPRPRRDHVEHGSKRSAQSERRKHGRDKRATE